MKASIIFPVKNEGNNLRRTLQSLYSYVNITPYEVIVVNDGSVDDGCDFLTMEEKYHAVKVVNGKGIGAANARNLGANKASGDYLVFCDAHLEFEDYWLDRLLTPLLEGKTDAVCPAIGAIGNSDFVGYGQTLRPNLRIRWNQNAKALSETAVLSGACLAISKLVFKKIGGFEKAFLTWGHEDVEISIKLWLFGYRCHVLPTVKVLHLFRKQLPYQVAHEDLYYNILWIAYSHFKVERIEKCKRLVNGDIVTELQKKAVGNGALLQRNHYWQIRRRTDDWYFTKFLIDF